MRRVRVIPVLQILNRKLVKTTRYTSPSYVGDPLNALRIFNEKQVDEIVVLDIGASRNGSPPDIDYIKQLASECFMPMAYGGGITSIEQASSIFQVGIEKIIIGTSFFRSPQLVSSISVICGSQSIMVSIDVKKDWMGREKVYVGNGSINTGYSPETYAKMVQEKGAGEILLNSIDLENTGKGYDESLVRRISSIVNLPVVPQGGANSVESFARAIESGASAVAAGNLFIYKGPHKAVLINYPDQDVLVKKLYSKF